MKPTRLGGAVVLGFVLSGCAGTIDTGPRSATPLPPASGDAGASASLPDRVATAPLQTSSRVDSWPSSTVPLTAPTVSAQNFAAAPAYVDVTPQAVPYRQASSAPAYVLQSQGYNVGAGPRRIGSMAPVRDDPFDAGPAAIPTRASTYNVAALKAAYQPSEALNIPAPAPTIYNSHTPAFGSKLGQSALARLNPNVAYVATYKEISYPWGDVPEDTGVCTDVVIRSYRSLGIDLQSLVHEDMKQAFNAYPSRKIYGLQKADPNIDHRRVVNLEAFFERVGASIPVGTPTIPGDIITWRLSGGEPHIGIVVDRRDPKTGNYLIVHNLGGGVVAEDLMDYAPAHGQYRFAPDHQSRMASLAMRRG